MTPEERKLEWACKQIERLLADNAGLAARLAAAEARVAQLEAQIPMGLIPGHGGGGGAAFPWTPDPMPYSVGAPLGPWGYP